MKSIQVNLKFPSNSELQSQMKQVVSYLEKQGNIDLKLDTKGFVKSIGEMNGVINKLKSELKNFGVLDSIVNENKTKQGTQSIIEQTEAIKQQQLALANSEKAIKNATVTRVDKNGNESVVKELSVIQDKYNQIIKTVDT